MYKRLLFCCGCLFFAVALFAQTLFTYGNDSVTVDEFLAAYKKNNPGTPNLKALQDYFDLYVASRLKIKEAKERHYDTLPQFLSDLEDVRNQIMPAYLNDEESVNRLVSEAFARSQKDLHVAHIFIGKGSTPEEAATASKKLTEVLAALKKSGTGGKNAFADVAKKYSDDPSAKTNGGDLGWIAVFSLPYELENAVYATPVGKTSVPYTSKAGYHIFKNLGERPAAGRIKAAQIILAFPPGADASAKAELKKRVDSIYNRLLKGDDFGKLAEQFSNDPLSAQARGTLPEFGVGQYDPVFEQTVFSLPKDRAVSPPFLLSYGYCIVKRLARVPVSTRLDDKTKQSLRETVLQSDRMRSTTAVLAQKILKNGGFKKAPFREAELWAYTDSVLDYKKPALPVTLNGETVLFQLNNKKITVANWITYAQVYRYKSDGSGLKPYPQLWDEFVQAAALDEYKAHLEQYNDAFRRQINEFKEGNLFFEIMQRELWGPSQNDTAALERYYEQHKAKYTWKESADAIIFYAADAATAQTLAGEIKKNPAAWRTLVAGLSEKITADSGRFEWTQLPNATGMLLKAGTLTIPLVNKTDNTASFAYVVKVYTAPSQRTFAEAKGLVINDYTAEREKQWISTLR